MNCKKILALFVLLCLSISPLSAQQVRTFVDTDSLQVGDTFSFSIVLDGDYNLLEYPSEEHFGEDIEMISRQRFQISSRRDSIAYQLQFFDVENSMIPEQEILLNVAENDTTITTREIPLFFNTTLAEDDEAFRPFKPIYDFAVAKWPYILGFILFLIAAWIIYRYIQNQKQKEPVSKPVFQRSRYINPLDILEKSLAELKTEPPKNTEEEFDQFYIQLGDAIRLYLKRVYQFPALEMTSGEILNELKKNRASFDLVQSTKKVLFEADMVKFANFTPGNEQLKSALKTADDFLSTAKTVDVEKINYLEYQHDMKEEERLAEFNKKHAQEDEEVSR
ncbi:MAG: hypothetical protein WEA58_05475 [Balneolaceae bacterium]